MTVKVALIEMLKKKQASAPVTKSAEKLGGYVQKGNVFELLKQSLMREKPDTKKPKKKAATGQREMMLPIKGSKQPEEKKVTKPAAKQRKAG